MTKILLAVDETVVERFTDETVSGEIIVLYRFKEIFDYQFEQAKQDAQEMIKQAKLGLIDEILNKSYTIKGYGGDYEIIEIFNVLLLKSEIEKE